MGVRTKREWFLLISLLAAIFVIYVLLNATRRPWANGARVEELSDDAERLPQANPPKQIADTAQTPRSPPTPRSDGKYGRQMRPSIRSLSGGSAGRQSISERTSGPGQALRTSARATGATGRNTDRPAVKGTRNRTREEMCRRILETIYNDAFPKVCPEFLRSPKSNRKLELDGYNERLGIAFEHQGMQHYKKGYAFSKGREERKEQKWRDDMKVARCRAAGVWLILVPEDVPEERLEEYITFYLPHEVQRRDELRTQGWAVPERPFETPMQRGYSPPSYEENTNLTGITSVDI